MKIDKKDLKHNILGITPENLTDLYILSQIINEKDQLYSFTTRRVRTPGKESREGDKGERIKVYLGIQVLEVEFQDTDVDQRLRVKGKIISGPDDVVSFNSTHTINIAIGQNFSLQKENWLDYHFEILKKSAEANRPIIGLVAIEPGLFTIASINNFKIQIYIQERNQIPSKQSNSKIRSANDSNFFKKILNLTKIYFSDDSIRNIVIAGPGSYKTKFLSYLHEEWRNHNKIILVEDLSSAYEINELITRQNLQKLAGQYQILEESAIITEFEKRLGQNFEKICYGLNQCLQSAEQGALENILFLDTLLRSENETEKYSMIQLMEQIDKTKVKFLIVDSKTENGKIVKNFGGLIGLLRYSIFFDNDQ